MTSVESSREGFPLVLLILRHALALIISVASVLLIVAVMNVAHRLDQSILRDDGPTLNQDALVLAAFLGGTAATLAIVTALVDRSGQPIVPTWGPGVGLALLGVAAYLLFMLTWWSWGGSLGSTPRQTLASDVRDALPWIAMGSYVGALNFGLVARRFATRSRLVPLWGAAFLAPAAAMVSIVVLASQRLS